MNSHLLLLLPLLPFIIIVAAAPIGTTILGWVAVAQIRRSSGRLCGLGLAIFDGLLFPLLALDALVGWWVFLLIDGLARFQHPEGGSANASGAISIAIPAVIVMDWLIVRAVWHAVNKPANGGAPAGPPQPAPRGRSGVGVMALTLAFAGLAVPLLAVQLAPVSSAATVFAVMVVVFLACELAALVLSALAWRSAVGKTALAATLLCCVLWGIY